MGPHMSTGIMQKLINRVRFGTEMNMVTDIDYAMVLAY